MVFSFQTQLNKIELLENDLSHFDCTLETLILKFKFKFNLLTMEVGSIIIIIIYYYYSCCCCCCCCYFEFLGHCIQI